MHKLITQNNQKILITNKFQYLLLLNKIIFLKKNKKLKKKINFIDYTYIFLLKNFLNKHGKIIPALEINIPLTYYKKITKAIKKARYLKLLPYTI